jgi:hypothetical protein
MPVCEVCDRDFNKCYSVDLTIMSDFDKDEEPFERKSTICIDCRDKIIAVFPKVEDEFF